METILAGYEVAYLSSAIVRIACVLIVLFGGVAGLLMAFIVANRYLIQYRTWRNERLVAKFEDDIFGILIEEQKRLDPRAYRFTVDRLRIAFSGSAVEALKKNLMLLGRDWSGDNQAILQELYQDLRLDQQAIRMLQEGAWYQKIAAIKELSYFGVAHAVPHLIDLAEDAHPVLRGEAQCALLHLGGAAQLNFLATLDQPLTRWQQIRIVNVLNRYEQPSLPEFHTFLTNPNESVTLFVLELIRVYKQAQARDAVVDKLFDTRPAVQLEAIKTVAHWLDQDVVGLLITISADGIDPVNVSVVQALRQWVYDNNTRTFLETVAETANNYTLRMSALRSLKLLGGKEAIAPLAQVLDQQGQRCLDHQLDDRI